MKFYCCLFFFLIYSWSCFAQNDNRIIPQVSFHSPEAVSLGKYIDYPVNLATGTMEINVPIFSLPFKSQQLEIALKYHTAGIKPSEAASSVGLGWSLWAGGEISRVLKGKPDEDTQGFLNVGKELPTYEQEHPGTLEGKTLSDTSVLAFKYRYNADTEPDEYYLQAPNLSVSFTVNNDGKYISNNLEPIAISYDSQKATFTVINKNGDTYRFGKSLSGKNCSETTTVDNSFSSTGSGTVSSSIPVPVPPYISSWKLTEIITADKTDTIFFDYNYYNSSYFLKTAETRSNALNLLEGNVDRSGTDYGAITTNYSTVNLSNVSLVSKITYKNNNINFNYINDRKDLVSMATAIPRLDFIQVNSKDQVIKTVKLKNDSYFDRSGASNSNTNMPLTDYLMKGLRLNSVLEYVNDPKLARTWEFYYDETPLPALRNTNAIDYWGYYNGKYNTSLIPSNFYTNANLGKPIFNGDGRKTDFSYMKAGILNKIKMPQGGYTTYEYEPNTYLTEPQKQNKIEVTKYISLYAANPTNNTPTCSSVPPIRNSLEFTVDEDLGGDMVVGNVTVNFSDYERLNLTNLSYPTASIKNINGSDDKKFTHYPANKDRNQPYMAEILIRKGNKYRIDLDLEGITGVSKYGFCGVPSIEFYLSYKHWKVSENTDLSKKLTQAGGLRIKKITNHDSLSRISDYSVYSYGDTLYGNEKMGAGELLNDIGNYFYFENVLWYDEPSSASLRRRMFFTSHSNSELGLNNGCPVYYNKVTSERFGPDNIPLGKTESFFTRREGELMNLHQSKYPYSNIIFPSWNKTEVSKEILYSFKDNKYTKIREISYDYGTDGKNKIKTLRLEVLGPQYSRAFSGGATSGAPIYMVNAERYFIHNNFVSTGRIVLKSQIQRDYFDRDSISTKTIFEYNRYFDRSKSIINSSTGQDKTYFTKYSGDLDSKLGTNMVSLPVLQETWKADKIMEGTILTRNLNGNISQVYKYHNEKLTVPANFTNYNTIPSGYDLDQKITYNANGTINSINLKNQPSVVYLWGYSGQYPIAEIRNATYADVEKVLTLVAINNLNSATHSEGTMETLIKNAADKLRSDPRLAQAMVTSYTYKPLVGMTSKTDPRGVKETYKYDGMQRLQAVLDDLDNVTKAIDYHYRPN